MFYLDETNNIIKINEEKNFFKTENEAIKAQKDRWYTLVKDEYRYLCPSVYKDFKHLLTDDEKK
jgi:hypothetical protein